MHYFERKEDSFLVVNNPPANTRDAGLIPGSRKIPQALGAVKPEHNGKAYALEPGSQPTCYNY